MTRNRKYEEFVPKEDNVQLKIKAKDINELQASIGSLQKESFEQADRLFLDRCMNALEHHSEANAMIVDLLEDLQYFKASNMKDIVFKEETRSLFLAKGAKTGIVNTNFIINETGKPIRFPFLLADQYMPNGSSIKYEISYDGSYYHELKVGSQNKKELEGVAGQFMLRVTILRDNLSIEPRLDAWALLFVDEKYSFRFLDDGLTFNIESMWDGTIIK